MYCKTHPKETQWIDSCLICYPALLHSWDNGVTYNEGGFGTDDLHWFVKVLLECKGMNFAETGAGNSTIASIVCRKLTYSFSWDSPVINDIKYVLDSRSVDYENWHPIVGDSLNGLIENKLPALDFALIDGGHGFPTPITDFSLLNLALKKGSFIFIDDIHLPTPRLLAQHMYKLGNYWFELISISPSEKTLLFKKNSDHYILPDWGGNSIDRNSVLDLSLSLKEIVS